MRQARSAPAGGDAVRRSRCPRLPLLPSPQDRHDGRGGAVTTNVEEYDLAVRRLRHHGIVPIGEFDIPEPGLNYRLPDILCAIGLTQLERLDALLAERERVAALWSVSSTSSRRRQRPTATVTAGRRTSSPRPSRRCAGGSARGRHRGAGGDVRPPSARRLSRPGPVPGCRRRIRTCARAALPLTARRVGRRPRGRGARALRLDKAGFSACPPNCLRSAERTLFAKSSCPREAKRE